MIEQNTLTRYIAQGEVVIKHNSTTRMIANRLAKVTVGNVFQSHVKSIVLCRI